MEVAAESKDVVPTVAPAMSSSASYTEHPPDAASVASNMSPTRSAGPSSPIVSSVPQSTPSGFVQSQQQQQPVPAEYPTTRDRSGLTNSDDDHTEPSSATGTVGYTRSEMQSESVTSTFGKMIEGTKKRLNTRQSSDDKDDDDDDDDNVVSNALIYGYLKKLGRNGKWQTRWFETDGECLTYYKSSKRIKLLATLDLAKVGSIIINRQDRSGTSFTINISQRPYHLKADSVAACKDWVITLNRVKEARLHEGNVKLVSPQVDLLDNYPVRVVVQANRQRTRAIDDDDMQSWENGTYSNPAEDGRGFIRTGRLARWQKPRTSLSRLATQLAKWARSIRKSCVDVENHVVLDHHLHPPGHDDQKSSHKTTQPVPASVGRTSAILASDQPQANKVRTQSDDADDGIRYLS